jgi:hypothetical protein
MLSYLGKYARTSAAREIVWNILRRDDDWAQFPFTMKDFYQRHKEELDKALINLKPDAPVDALVKGALQSLCKKGLIFATRSWGNAYYSKNIYMMNQSLRPYTYGRALIEAQRLRLL